MTGWVATVAYSLLGLAALLAVTRIARGPSVLDRAVASEVVVAIVVCALGVQAATDRHPHGIPILVSLSVLGFLGSVAVVRFVPRDVDPGRHPLATPDDPREGRAGAADVDDDLAGPDQAAAGSDGRPGAKSEGRTATGPDGELPEGRR